MSQIKQRSLLPLFYSPLLVFEVPNSPALNQSLLRDIAPIKQSTPNVGRSNRGGWHSADDLFDRPEQSFRQLCLHIKEAIGSATTTVAPHFDFSSYGVQAQGWVNVLVKDAINVPHDHAGWAWSGVYYVAVPESDEPRAGHVEFLDSRTNVGAMTVEGAPCFASKFTFNPEAGLLIIFPSYLKHWVYPNESEHERVSIAFNARFVREQ